MAAIVVIATVCTLKSYSSLRDLVFPSEVLESDSLEAAQTCADEKRLFVSFNIFSTVKINHVGYENVNVYTIDIGLM